MGFNYFYLLTTNNMGRIINSIVNTGRRTGEFIKKYATVTNLRKGISHVDTFNKVTKALQEQQHNETVRKIAEKIPSETLDSILGIAKHVNNAISLVGTNNQQIRSRPVVQPALAPRLRICRSDSTVARETVNNMNYDW